MRPMSWPRNIVRRCCAFCDWYLDDAGPAIDTDALVSVRGKTPAEAIQNHIEALHRLHVAKVEQALQEHLDTHVEQMATS
jgi:hypothetical protein